MARRDLPTRGVLRRGRATGVEVRGSGYRPRGRDGGGRGALSLLIVLAVGILVIVFVLPGLLGGLFRGMAEENPDWLRLPFVADAVRAEIGDRLDTPAGSDATPVEFVIAPDTSARQITENLIEREIVRDRLAFSFILITEGVGNRLQAGAHTLARNMTPRQVASVLVRPPAPSDDLSIALRDGLRIEQVTAYLLTVEQLNFDPAEFYQLATTPPAELAAEFPMLSTIPVGRSLEGYLSFGLFEVERDIDAAGFLRTLLGRRQAEVGDLLGQAPPDGLADFYQVMTLASIVEAETDVDEERPLVAGVYLNRLDRSSWPTRLLNADPTVLYGNDTLALRDLPLEQWVNYVFWAPPGRPMAEVFLRDDLAGYQTYQRPGIPPGPIRSPSLASIEAVLSADTESGYLYFVAKNDGTRTHAFARTFEEHLANVERYQGGDAPSPTESP
jgi:UPF0755 protein